MTADAAWRDLATNLADCLGALEEDEFLIISKKHANVFVQFAGQGWYGMRAEAVCNSFIQPPTALLTEAQYAAMDTLGWHRATNAEPDPAVSGDVDGSPNFFVDVPRGSDHAAVAEMAVRTLRDVNEVGHPGQLEYAAFHEDGTSIRFPTLRILRHRPESQAE